MIIPVGQSDNMQNLIKIAKTDGGYEYQDLQTVKICSTGCGYRKRTIKIADNEKQVSRF